MRTTSWSTLVMLAIVSAALAAQQPPPLQPPPLTFRVEINYVEIDASVTDAQGNFVRDLTKDDFQVFEEGKPQALSVFSLVEIPVERVDPPLFAKNPIPPDVQTNRRPFEGRVFVLLLDGYHTSAARSLLLRRAAALFVQRYVGANDVVAVVETSGASAASQEFTSNRQLVLNAINRFMGQKADSPTKAAITDALRNQDLPSGAAMNSEAKANDFERGYKAQRTLEVLKNVADYLAGIRGRRKAVVLFSEGIDYDITQMIGNDTAQFGSQVMDATREAVGAATRSNVSIYGVDPRGLTNMGDELIEIGSLPAGDNTLGMTSLMSELRLSQDSLRVLSDQTGGFAVVNANDFRNAFDHIVRDNSSYYVLGYYPASEKRDGRYRSISVRVNRPGLTVRARKGYMAPKGKAEPTKLLAGTKTSLELREALTSPVAVSGLPITVFAAPFKGPTPKRGAAPHASINITLELDATKLKFADQNGVYTDSIELSLFAADSSDKIRDGAQDQVNLKLRSTTYDAVQKSGALRLTRALELPPGKYQMRVGAREANTGTVGTVVYDLDVPDFSKGDLTMSGIAVSSAFGSRIPTANPDPLFKQVLPAPPTALREFPRGDALALFAEIYDNAASIAHRVGITTSVLSDEGKVVYTTSDERRSEELQGSRGGYGYSTQIATAQFAPGRYVLRVEAKSYAKNNPTASREIEFRIK
jgi:VWFA-related protein